jgi:hypothetical protein
MFGFGRSFIVAAFMFTPPSCSASCDLTSEADEAVAEPSGAAVGDGGTFSDGAALGGDGGSSDQPPTGVASARDATASSGTARAEDQP